MKKLLVIFFALLVSFAGIAPAHAADTDNFTIKDFRVDMKLSRDEDKSSVLQTTETIVAEFPNHDQNRGLERTFVKEYDGHRIDFELIAVADGQGNLLKHHWSGDTLRIGDPDKYVHGLQTYSITYKQKYVTKFYKDTGKLEFYWDVIGVDWRVPIERVDVKLEIDESIRSSIATDMYCYAGDSGQDNKCGYAYGQAGLYQASHSNLSPGQGVTIALGFEPETFAAYEPTFLEKFLPIFLIVQVVMGLVSIGLLIYAAFKRSQLLDREKETDPIVPEYLPLKDISITTAAQVLSLPHSVMSAQLIDLAVRGYIKLYQLNEAKLLSPAQYVVEVAKDTSDLRWEEADLLADMFGKTPAVGDKLNIAKLKNNYSYYARTLDNDDKLKNLIRGEYGLRAIDPQAKKSIRNISTVMILLGVFTFSLPMLMFGLGIFAMSFWSWGLTDKGLATRRYLLGLKQYITVAEEERIKIMQSPDGAEKRTELSDAGTDIGQRIVLYEKLLPYAILFSVERAWSQQLGHYYEQTASNPDWYSGRSGSAFNAAAFSAGLSSLSSATRSVSSGSSSSGGSSGGGSVGGGGGGGGGGGW